MCSNLIAPPDSLRLRQALLQLLVVVLLFADAAPLGNNTDVVCHKCFDVASPEDCQEYVTCGKDEMCFTREFTNHAGKRGYHLGCESTRTCSILQNAETLFGKRSVGMMDSADTSLVRSSRDLHKCYRCCDSNFCNLKICNATVPNSGSGGCPHPFVKSPSKCYYMAQWSQSWDEARSACKMRGADLVSINTHEEQMFIEDNAGSSDYWIGGYFAHATQEWEWVDGTKLGYTNWFHGSPENRTGIFGYNIHLISDRQWRQAFKSLSIPFICEMGHV